MLHYFTYNNHIMLIKRNPFFFVLCIVEIKRQVLINNFQIIEPRVSEPKCIDDQIRKKPMNLFC
jgi:hypothetical protein